MGEGRVLRSAMPSVYKTVVRTGYLIELSLPYEAYCIFFYGIMIGIFYMWSIE
jgi:hypothetical protein